MQIHHAYSLHLKYFGIKMLYMTRIIAVALSKGGVGKTTTAVNLAARLAFLGRNVLLVDTDTQGQSARHLGVVGNDGLFRLTQGETTAETLIKARERLLLLSGGESIAVMKRRFNDAQYHVEQQLKQAMAPLLPYFDYVIIDNAPSWDGLSVNVMFAADEIIAPVTMETLAVQGLFDYKTRIERIGAAQLRYIVPTIKDVRRAQTAEIESQLRLRFGEMVSAPIRVDVRLSEAPAHGQTIFEYAPNSRGATDYEQLTNKVLSDET